MKNKKDGVTECVCEVTSLGMLANFEECSTYKINMNSDIKIIVQMNGLHREGNVRRIRN